MKRIASKATSALAAAALAMTMVPAAAFGAVADAAAGNPEGAVGSSSAIEDTLDDDATSHAIGDADGGQDGTPEDVAIPDEHASDARDAIAETPAEPDVVLDPQAATDNVTAFVTRLYEKVLDRAPDATGLASHVAYLRSGGSAAALAWTFFGSPEFARRPLSSGQRVEIAYVAMLDRAADAPGNANWSAKLDAGMSMRAVIAGFCTAPEFKALCAKWGISPGSIGVVENRDRNQSATEFVQRLYRKVLNRSADAAGLNAHTGALLGGAGAASTAWTFFASPEFANRGLSNSDKVEIAYQALLDRSSDASGKANWTSRLDRGMSLYSLISGFAQSNEFRKLCSDYGIKVGTVSGDAELDRILDTIISQRGSSLRSLFDYVASYPYVKGSTYPTGNWSIPFAKEMYWNGGGNCYRYAALFCELAKAVGYDAKVVSGHVPSRSMGQAPHGWVEININGTTYVCDPDMVAAYPTRNWYMFTYNNAPLNYIR